MMVARYAQTQPDIAIEIIDIMPRWRAVTDKVLWKRMLGGGLQLLRDSVRIFKHASTRPHIIHLTTPGSLGVVRDLAVMMIGRLFRIPVMYHIRFGRIPEIAHASTKEWKLISRAMRGMHTVIAIDSATADAIRHYLPDVRLELIPNCIRLDEMPAPVDEPEDEKTVMFLGWAEAPKGVEELVEAWSKIPTTGWRLQIIGPGDEAYWQQLRDRYQPERIDFLGEKDHDDAMQYMARAAIFTLPSHTEGFPNVVVEAMALGKPIVATRVGAIPDMLANESGVLVDARDAAGLADALACVMADASLRQHLGANARDRVNRNYTIEAVFARYTALWRQAAGRE
jgi:glycosyltransferase involved in cell wall biosynthesis